MVSNVNRHFSRKNSKMKEMMFKIRQKMLILKYSPTVVSPMSSNPCRLRLDSIARLKKEGSLALLIIEEISALESEETASRAAS